MGQIQSIEDLLNFLARRRLLILAVAVLGIVAAAVFAKSRPDTYIASAVIQVQGAQIGSEVLAGGGSAQALQTIEQRLTTRKALMAMIERHGLYADLPGLTDEEKTGLLRASIAFEGVASAGNQMFGVPAQISAVIISASDGDPEKAARIANDVAQGVLDMAAAGQMDRAQDTLLFYREEESRIAAEVAAIDDEIAAFKQANADALPAEAEARRDEIAEVDSDLRALEQDLVALIEEQRQLAARGELRATEQSRLQGIDSELAVLTEQKAALLARRDALQVILAQLPEVERVLSGLERQLRQAQAGLESVTTRLTDAETALRLAERQQGERLALLDRAVTPLYPSGSGGKKLFIAGALASVLGAIALAFVIDLLRPVVRTSAQMERQLGLRPVIALPELDLPHRPASRHIGRRGGGPGLASMGQKVLALPRMVLAAGGLTLVLMTAAALT